MRSARFQSIKMFSPIGSIFAFVLLIDRSITCEFFKSCHSLPEYLDRPINDSITFINLVLDDKRMQVNLKLGITVPTMANMNRGLNQGGEIGASNNVGRFVYQLFLSEVDSRSDLMMAKVQESMEEASKSVLCKLSNILVPCELDVVRQSIEKLLERISPELSNLRIGIYMIECVINC